MKPGKTTVKVGMITIPIYADNRGRFIVKYKEDGVWKNTVSGSYEKAAAKARDIARRLHNGEAALNDLSADEVSVLARARKMQVTHAELDRIAKARGTGKDMRLVDAGDAWFAAKLAKREGRYGVYIAPMVTDFKQFTDFIGDVSVADLTADWVDAWLVSKQAAGVGPRRLLNLYNMVRGFLSWCQETGILAVGEMPIRKASRPVVRKTEVEIYTPDDWKAILQLAWDLKLHAAVLWLASTGFAGLRSQEVMPTQRCEKTGLRWENIHWEQSVIVVPETVAKTNARRIMPILPAWEAWVKPLAKTTGPLISSEARNITRQLGAKLEKRGLRLLKNGARHSYGSYRTADVMSAGQVALEMGNSETMIKRHYLYAVTKPDAEKWWAIRPQV